MQGTLIGVSKEGWAGSRNTVLEITVEEMRIGGQRQKSGTKIKEPVSLKLLF